MNWPADRIERRKVSSLIPYARNARTHSEAQVAQIAASIKEWGWTTPVVIGEDGGIIAGHGRILAAQVLGYDEVPCAVATGWTDAQKKAYVLADNKLALNAGWDEEMLRVELNDLELSGFDVSLTGFDAKEILAMEPPPEVNESDNDAPELKEEAVSQTGEIYELGDHLLMCGDSTNPEDVARLMGMVRADCMVTDPPYNVAYEGRTKEKLKIDNDNMSNDDFREFLRKSFETAFSVMKPGASFYIWHADSEGYNFRGAVYDNGEKVRQCLIWKKNCLVMGRQDYQWQHEPCLYGWKDGASHGWYSDRKQTTVLEFNKPSKSTEHPTMKPVELFQYLISNSTAPQGVIFDPFLGSGTSLIASANLGRICRGMELSPNYCDVIRKRYTKMAKEKGWKLGTGALE